MNTAQELWRDWREQRRLHHIEAMLENLRQSVEKTNLKINRLIREKSAIEISQSRRETS